MTCQEQRSGFILLETLAALSIFALVAGAIFVAVQTAARADAEARFKALAGVLARSALETAGVESALADGRLGELRAAGLVVVVDAACDRTGKEAAGLVGCWLDATARETEGAGRSLTLRTYRLAEPAGP
jgi:type II secretory pathway pseudopilin PulG